MDERVLINGGFFFGVNIWEIRRLIITKYYMFVQILNCNCPLKSKPYKQYPPQEIVSHKNKIITRNPNTIA